MIQTKPALSSRVSAVACLTDCLESVPLSEIKYSDWTGDWSCCRGMERSIRSRTSSTSSVRSPAVPGTPAPTPARTGPAHLAPSPDQLTASLSRLRAERALSIPATPAPTPNPALPHPHHSLHPEAILDGLSGLGGDEGIASCSVPGTPQPTPFSPSPGHHLQLDPGQVAASIARLREEGVSTVNTQPATPVGTPAGYLHPLAGAHHLGVIPEHLAEGINNSLAGRGQDEGLESGSNPATPTPTPFSPSPALHHSLLAEQLTAGINRLRVETDGMSSGGSTGLPATPAPTPFSHGPGGVRPEDLAASISRLSVIQEADTGPSISVLDASGGSDQLNTSTGSGKNPNNLSNYFGTPQNAGESIFDQISSPIAKKSSEAVAGGTGGLEDFTDVTINTPVKRLPVPGSQVSASPSVKTAEAKSEARDHPAPVTPKQPRRELLPEVRTEVARPESPRVPRSAASETEQDVSVAWVPSPAVREILANLSTFYPSRDQLTLPGVSAGSEQTEPVRDCVAKYQGESEASKRQVAGSDSVTADTRGLSQLLSIGNFRSAVNLTGALLEMYGQGRGKTGQLSKHSPTSLQIWWVRLALLVKLRQFSTAEAEAAAFGSLESPDLFYQFYPDLHPGKRGSLVPWGLRLLLAELPSYNNKQVVAMNRLLRLQRLVKEIIGNLEAGMEADGQAGDCGEEKQRLGLEIWRERERQVVRCLVNSCLLHQDYEAAVKCLQMLKEVETPAKMASLLSATGRVYLQLGSLALADISFSQAAKARETAAGGEKEKEVEVEALLDSAFLAIGQGQFQTAAERFSSAEKLVSATSKQGKMINNNIAVCLLYVGKLKEGLARLESDITEDPANIQVKLQAGGNTRQISSCFQGNIMLNLATLYELESSYAMQKKIGMLGMVSQYSSDSFNISALKL